MAVGNQSANEVDQKVARRTMACMLDLRDVLELVDDRLYNRSLAQAQLVHQ